MINEDSLEAFDGSARIDDFLHDVWSCVPLRYQAMEASYTFIYIFLLLICRSQFNYEGT